MTLVALESNPKVFNSVINQLGFEGVEFHELLGFDPDLVSFVPPPHLAMIFCYPYQKKACEYRKNIYGKLVALGTDTVPEWAFFLKQFVTNACGYHAICHAIFNNFNHIRISDDGYFAKMSVKIKKKEKKSVEDSASSKSSNSQSNFVTQMTDYFNEISLSDSETAVPERTDHHFIVYVVHDGRLFEFDSLQKFPRDCGPSSEETLLVDAGNVCKELMDQLDEISCNAIVLSAKEK